MKKNGFISFFTGRRRNKDAKPPKEPPKALSTSTASNVTTFLNLPRDVHFILSDYLSFTDWRSMQLTCARHRDFYQREDLWRRRAANMMHLPEFVFDHPDFKLFKFDFRRLVQVLVTGGNGLRAILSYGVAPWQLAALLRMEKELEAVYPGDAILELEDEHSLGVVDYYIIAGHEQGVERWGRRFYPNFNAADDTDDKFPTLAVCGGKIETLDFLVNRYKYNLKRFNVEKNRNLLYAAIQFDNIKTFDHLLKIGVSTEEGENLLAVAAKFGRWNMYKSLYDRGMRLPRFFLKDVLINAAESGNSVRFDLFRQEMNRDLSHESLDFRLSLFKYIIQGGNLDLVKEAFRLKIVTIAELIKAEINIFHLAAQFGHITLLLELEPEFAEHFDPRAEDAGGNTLLHKTAIFGEFRNTLLLLRRFFDDVDLLRPNNKGETIAHLAANNCRLYFLHSLSKYCRSVVPLEALDGENNSALHQACMGDAKSVIFWLLDNTKLSLLDLNKSADTPLHLLAKRKLEKNENWINVMSVARLVDYSVITDSKNNAQQTVKDLMLQGGQENQLAKLAQNSSTKPLPSLSLN